MHRRVPKNLCSDTVGEEGGGEDSAADLPCVMCLPFEPVQVGHKKGWRFLEQWRLIAPQDAWREEIR